MDGLFDMVRELGTLAKYSYFLSVNHTCKLLFSYLQLFTETSFGAFQEFIEIVISENSD